MHELEIQRLKYPRVSDVIGIFTYMEMKSIPLEVLANACIRGEKVHEYCTSFLQGLWLPEIEEEYKPYVDAFIEWSDKNIDQTYFTCVRLYDDMNRFTGEFDIIAKLKDGRVALLDIKTSCTTSKSWPIQLAAYNHLCQINGYQVDCIINVHLKKTKASTYEEQDGVKVKVTPPVIKAKALEYENIKPYWEIFASALKSYDYFQRKEEGSHVA